MAHSNNITFSDIGFLSAETTTNTIAQQVVSSQYYQICTNLNRLAQSVLNHAIIHPDDRKEVYATLYFQRLLSHYQAIILMAERCMVHQVEVLLRVLLETLFDLVAFHNHDDFFEALILGDNDQRLDFLKKIRQQQQIATTYTQQELTELDAIILSAEDVDRSDFRVFMKADLADMLHEYRTSYSLLSETIHSSVHSMEDDLIIDKETEQINGIKSYGEATDDMFGLLMTASNFMIRGMQMILEIVPNSEQQVELDKVSQAMQNEWQRGGVAVAHR